MDNHRSGKDLVKRTAKLEKELSAKTHELEIEAALEKVRTVAMRMNKPGDVPGVCKTLFKQFLLLGFSEMRNAMVNIHNDADKSVINYDYSDEIGESTNQLTYNIHPLVEKQIKKIRSANDAFSETYFSGKDLVEWRKFRKRIGEKNDPRLRKTEGLYYYFYSIGTGSIGISTFGPISKEKKALLKRFRNVFNLSYQRYIDIAKAEAQAREAQIETALERVRSRTMAMHRSEEIADILGKMFEELKRLDMVLVRVLIWIFNHEEKYISWWSANAEVENTANSYRLDYNEHPVFLACLEAWQKKVPLKLYTLSGAEKDSWQDHLFNNTGLSKLPDMVQKGMRSEGTIFTTSAISDYGLLMSGSLEPLSDENTDIIQRFGRVFQQSYTRYIDVQKAEAQARESQIQLALERVRARTMAMQKSDELVDTAVLLFQQIKELGIQQWGNSFQLWDDDMKAVEAWTCTQGMEIQRFKIPATEDPAMINIVKAAQKREDLYVEEMGGEALKNHYKFMYSLPIFKEILDNLAAAGITPPKFQVMYAAYFSYGYILFITHEPFPEAHDIFKRFAKVFEQTYTRFLDLQKAEEQAREAKIEAALEKVRSRSLAMHKSDELWEVVAVVFEKFQELNFAIDGAAFITTFIEGTRDINGWVAGNESQPYPTNLRLPYLDSPSINDIWKAKESGLDFFSKTYSFEEKNQWLRYAFENSGLKSMTDEFKNWILEQPCMTQSLALGKNSILGIHFHYNKTLSETEIDVLKRFSKVFDQAYIRFLDLQKAEAQARESQIQLALERVRARTMAMQRSDELADASHLLERQVAALGIKTWGCAFHIFKENDSLEYHSNADGVMPTFVIPRTYVWQRYYEACQRGETLIIEERVGEACAELYEYMAAMPVVGEELQKMKAAGIPFPTYQVEHAVSFKYGYLLFITFEQVPEAHDIFIRFAKVFEQTYTRFLDLQKAEGQAREAQIQLALERVRARTMAMQKSDELPETAAILFEQFKSLGQELMQMTIGIMNEADGVIEFSVTDWSGSGAGVNRAFNLSIEEPSLIKKLYAGWKENKRSIVVDLTGKELENWISYRNKMSGVTVNSADTGGRRVITGAFFSKGHLSVSTPLLPVTESIQLLERFAQVFDLTYTRFLDLQKAETQARESQIQLALERVRARTMAMQKSDELAEAARVLYEEFRTLNISTFLCGYCFYKEEQDKQTVWVTFPDGTIIPDFIDFPITGDHILNKRYEDWKQKKPLHVLEIKGEENKEHHRFLASKVSDQAANEIFAQIPDRIIVYGANFSTGYLFIIATELLTGEEEDVIIRFAKVFELTYTRFNDLKQAEAQAREAQIQLALERVRARTMAMQKSDELMEASNLLLQQVQSLGIPVWACGYNIWEPGERVCTAWMSVLGAIQPSFRLPLTEHPTFIHMYESRLKAEASYVEEVSGEELADHYRYMFSLPDFREIATKQLQGSSFPLPQSQAHHVFNFKHGNLIFLSAEALPEARDIFKRFTAVFEQTYTRFLDLQKAEAQAREAKIEAALENVRSRSLAMHHSNELKEVVKKVFEKMKELGFFQNNSVMIVLPKNGFKDVLHWTFNEHFETLEYNIPAFNHSVSTDSYKAWERGEKTCEIKLNKEEKDDFLYQIFTYTDYSKVPDEFKKHLYSTEAYNSFIVFENHCGLLVDTFTSVNYSEDQKDVVKRFAKVFEQAYIRFLDLQKAEAQARQAQIEASLERVRASAMAMHRSDELSNVLAILFEQFDVLKIQPVDVHLDLFDLEKNTFSYRATGKEGKRVIAEQIVDLGSRPEWQALLQKWKKGKPNTVDFSYYPKEVIRELMAFFPDIWAAMPEDAIMSPEDFPDGIFDALGFCKFGYIGFHHHRKATEEEQKILIRFANEFERLYQRFLDLQKAEAQAREAQIELGLERVRARAMAMQRSDELSELVDTVFKELTKLDFALTWCIINIIDEPSMSNMVWAANPDIDKAPDSYHMKFEDYPFHHAMMKGWKQRKTKYVYVLEGTEKKIYDKYLFNETEFRKVPQAAQAASSAMEKYVVSFSFSNFGGLQTVGDVPLSDANLDILSRFGKVFDLTYTRFNDLKQAEAQARESQIQLALERVRARTMAMQKSNEMTDVAGLLFEQVSALGIKTWTAGFNVWSEDNNSYVDYITSPQGGFIEPYTVYTETAEALTDISNTRKSGVEFDVQFVEGEKIKQLYLALTKLDEKQYEVMLHDGVRFPSHQYEHFVFGSKVSLMFITYEPVPEAHDIFKRLGKVFEQTYTRFLDLQKAEAQAREAQIEAALERVRSRSMGMQKSEELKEVIQVVYEQFVHLNIYIEHTGFIMDYMARDDMNIWLADKHEVPFQVTIPYFDCAHWNSFNEAKEKGKDFFANKLSFEEKNKFYRDLFKLIPGVPDETKEYYFSCPGLAISTVLLENVGLYIENFSGIAYSDEENNTLMRFGKVFQQTYTRFLDLQKAEAQAREAKVETALEKVRSRTMAMQHSDELGDVAEILFKQVKELGIHPWSTGFNIWKEGNDAYIDWITNPSGGFVEPYTVDLTTHPFFREISDAKKRGEDFHVFGISGEPLRETYALLMSFAPKQFEGFMALGFSFPTRQFNHYVFGAQVSLMFITHEPYPEAHDIFKRFGKVFEQTYTRFLDLQKAEAQARESQIEAALERVRSRTMGMQRSTDLQDTASILFSQVQALGAASFACGFNIWDDDRKAATAWMAREDGIAPSFKTSSAKDVFFHIHEAAQRGESLFVREQGGDELETHYRYMATIPVFKEVAEKMAESGVSFPSFQVMHCAFFSQGYLMFITYQPVPGAHDIFKRFAKVFEQTYTRFLDLQKAEAQAREAIKRASVDRVRAEIASMRTTNDLERITPLIWNELTTLGVPFVRCGVFIMDEEKQLVETHLSTPDGKAIASFTSTFTGTQLLTEILPYWQRKEVYKAHWDEAMFLEQAKSLVKQGAITSGEKYLTENRPTDLYLHFLPFLQGMLYAGNTAPLSDDALQLMQNLADAFSTAYARYEDFNKLEVAKEQIEKTLVDLKQAQTQLVQSEKMASLGELTAGIAHEIQNPLNFVNNFSDVNKELLEELKEEADKGNIEEIKAIANDVINNEEKINHHGKRADAIVKNMLQHSRSSGAAKELTDINKLADEYLRLSYHGLRAKDKSFNADFKTELDNSVGKINVIPQDIGRVILNVITNAFYAVNEKKKSPHPLKGGMEYKPTVSIITKKNGDNVEIIVADNGNGISQKNIDKIFQPFFTTKPTGQGTGLGLSLSYDIVKAHGGEIKVESKEGEGSEFVIQLPV